MTWTLEPLREGFVGEAFTAQPTCPFCGSQADFWARARNIHPSHACDFSLRSCRHCAHLWIDPLPTQPLLDHLYGCGSKSVIHMGYESEERPMLTIPERRVLAAEGSGAPRRYFELGVGKGVLFREFDRRGWQCSGVEPGNWGSGILGVKRSLEEIGSEEAFDLLVAMDVLEHIRDPIAVLRQLRSRAGPGARLYAAFPNRQSLRGVLQRERWRMVRPLGHVHYFSRASATLMLREAGFALRRARTTDLVDLRSIQGFRSLAFGAAQIVGWGDQWLVSAMVAG